MNLLDHIYNCFPKIYREEDEADKYLYRYLSAIIAGGYGHVLKDSEHLTDLLDPQRCPESLLQFFYRSFGLTYFPDIDPIYHRRVLSNLGGIIQRRGTYSCINFLVRAITGASAKSIYVREGGERKLTVQVICETLDQLNALSSEMGIMNRFLQDYLPFYINLFIEGVVDVSILSDTRNDIVIASTSTDYVIQQNPNQP